MGCNSGTDMEFDGAYFHNLEPARKGLTSAGPRRDLIDCYSVVADKVDLGDGIMTMTNKTSSFIIMQNYDPIIAHKKFNF